MELDQITPLILTYNEECNIGRVLDKLHWAKQIVVVDSRSTDRTAKVVRAASQATLVEREFDTHATQWNFGLDCIKTEWVLTLDADYILSDDFVVELEGLSERHAYSAILRFCVLGTSLESSILPPRIVLFPVEAGRFYDDGHTQRLDVSLPVVTLNSEILHDDRKSFGRWFQNQIRYMKKEALKLSSLSWAEAKWSDRVRKLIFFAPVLVLLYCLFVKRGILEGLPGIVYALQRSLAEIILSFYIIKSSFV